MCVVLCKTKNGQNMYFFSSIIKDRKMMDDRIQIYSFLNRN